jgi:hypothetical protein
MQRADNRAHEALQRHLHRAPPHPHRAQRRPLPRDSGAGTIFVLRGVKPRRQGRQIETFATGLDHPFGIAFYPLRPQPRSTSTSATPPPSSASLHSGDLHATGPAETIVPDIPGYAQLTGGGHWTRDVVFTKDGKYMLVSVGSGSNVDDADTHPREFHRADVLEYTPDGKFVEVYAHGIRNCVGEAINPITGSLWCSTNERDNLGNHLVPDYVTSVPRAASSAGPGTTWEATRTRASRTLRQRHRPQPQLTKPLTDAEAKDCKREDLSSKVARPTSSSSPTWPRWRWSSTRKTKCPRSLPVAVLRRRRLRRRARQLEPRQPRRLRSHLHPHEDGHATGEYDDFLTGFVTPDGQVWGRPVGVAVGNDGSLFVTDDGSRSVWHVDLPATPPPRQTPPTFCWSTTPATSSGRPMNRIRWPALTSSPRPHGDSPGSNGYGLTGNWNTGNWQLVSVAKIVGSPIPP